MSKILLSLFYFLLLFFYPQLFIAQNLYSLPYLDNGISPYYIERIIVDSVHDKLIVSSKYLKYANGKKVRGICSWNGVQWDSLGGGINTHNNLTNEPNGTVLGGVHFNGKLLVGGVFESIGGVNATSLAAWNNAEWDSLPTRAFKFLDYGGFVYCFTNYNNKLYIGGSFDTIQGYPANGLTIFDGGQFQPIQLPLKKEATIIDMKVYNNELYISGVFSHSTITGNHDILRYDGNEWSTVGGGVKGNFSSIASMAVYNNFLFVAGYFEKTSGNSGNLIMKWDGNNWHDAGWGDVYQNSGIYKLLVHNNKLFAFGSFNAAGNYPASKIAVLDGNNWCALQDSINGNILSSAIYRDTIYIAGSFININGDTSKKWIAKLSNENLYRSCTPINVPFNSYNNHTYSIFPNPTNDLINVTLSEEVKPKSTLVKIIDMFGKEVKSAVLSENKKQISLSGISAGCYILEIKHTSGLVFYEKIIKN